MTSSIDYSMHMSSEFMKRKIKNIFVRAFTIDFYVLKFYNVDVS